jgi:hypothetical protein
MKELKKSFGLNEYMDIDVSDYESFVRGKWPLTVLLRERKSGPLQVAMFTSPTTMYCISHHPVSSNAFPPGTKCMDAVIVELFGTFQAVIITKIILSFFLSWDYADLNYLVATKGEEHGLNYRNNRATWNAR